MQQISKVTNMQKQAESLNVFGEPLEACSDNPRTGFYRDGCCNTGVEDAGDHVVCAQMTASFLEFSSACGNDLSTPRPEAGFAGLKPGDCWCLCALRWQEAFEAGVAPPIFLKATHQRALDMINIETLKQHAIDLS